MPKKLSRHHAFHALMERAKASKASERPRSPTFAEVMAKAGTVPLADNRRRVPPARVPPLRSAALAARAERAPTFTVAREEDWLEGYRAEVTSGTRGRLRGTPAATLDLHGDDVETARRKVSKFLATERARGRQLVLIVVGKGRHSPGGHAVLRHELADWLTSAPAALHVLAFRTAPRGLGGSGGVLVLLARA